MPVRHLTLALILLAIACQHVLAQPARDPAVTAWSALESGDAGQAAAAFREALSKSPQDATLHFGAGLAAHLLGRADQARKALTRALEIDPRLAPAALLLGEMAYAAGDLEAAIRLYEKALASSSYAPEIQHRLEEWRREDALHRRFDERPGLRFRVLFEGPEEQALAARVAEVLEAAYWQIGQALNAYPGRTIMVVLYTQEQFRDVTRVPAWASGAYDGRIRVPARGALLTPEELDRVVIHEFVHAAIESLAPRGVPRWLHEGLAVALEPGDQTWIDRQLRSTRARIPFEHLQESFHQLGDGEVLLAYAQSAAAARKLLQRLGPRVSIVLQALGNGQSLEYALSGFGISLAELHP